MTTTTTAHINSQILHRAQLQFPSFGVPFILSIDFHIFAAFVFCIVCRLKVGWEVGRKVNDNIASNGDRLNSSKLQI